MAARMAFEVGTLVAGKYRIVRPLGEGGMGTVYVAENQRLHKEVALKVLSDAATGSPEAAERFMREAIAASRVKHPGIVEIYDADVHEGQPWIAMEQLHGESLGQRLEPAPPVRRTRPRPRATSSGYGAGSSSGASSSGRSYRSPPTNPF